MSLSKKNKIFSIFRGVLHHLHKEERGLIHNEEQPNLEIISRFPEQPVSSYPIIFVHGAFHGAWSFNENFIPYFSEHNYEVHALSLRGYGAFDNKLSALRMTFDRAMSNIETVVRYILNSDSIEKRRKGSHNPSKVILVGHSAGGGLVQKFAESFPSLVEGVILLASFPPFGGSETLPRWYSLYPKKALKAVFTFNATHLLESPDAYKEAMFCDTTDSKLVEKYFCQLERKETLLWCGKLLKPYVNVKKSMKKNKDYNNLINNGKVLVIGGMDDPLIKPSDVAKTAKIYKTNAMLFQGMSHQLLLDNRWKDVADYVVQWLIKNVQ